MFLGLLRLVWIALLIASPALVGVEQAAARSENDGFLYGRVVTESGNEYSGFLRWGTEESFWDDLFHSTKVELPYRDLVKDKDRPRSERREEKRFMIFRWKVRVQDWMADRVLISRFGDIAAINPRRGDDAELVMKSGEVIKVSGYSNDVGGKIRVDDRSLGRIDLPWDRIETIEFKPAPKGEDPGVFRLHGKVESDAGLFEGFIQWDKQECLSSDLLDGDTDDGEVSIEMGRIRSIERRGRRSSLVELKDGRTLRMRGSNDVNSDNRGIMVEDPRYGRVTVTWDAFDKLTFSDPGASGRGYGDFKDQGWLTGTVTTRDGKEHRGRLVIDLDEAQGWEILNGEHRDCLFDIPLNMVQSIEPQDEDESLVTLRSGERLTLEDGQDVSGRNDGVLVFAGKDDRDPTYLRWEEVQRIRLDW